MAEAKIDTTDGVLILPRKVSWTIAASVVGAILYFGWLASGALSEQAKQPAIDAAQNARITVLEGDRDRLTRLETQMGFAIEILKRLDDRARGKP